MAKALTAADLVDIDSVPKTRRGRTATVVPELKAALELIQPGKALPLGSIFPKTDLDKRSAVGQTIRNHWKMIHGDAVKCSINWSTEGVPFVSQRS